MEPVVVGRLPFVACVLRYSGFSFFLFPPEFCYFRRLIHLSFLSIFGYLMRFVPNLIAFMEEEKKVNR
jgi:hypothetical protein